MCVYLYTYTYIYMHIYVCVYIIKTIFLLVGLDFELRASHWQSTLLIEPHL
jgi:hypothetical protein